jgi:GntR family transcriptional regulator/MocR family aminotransferase
MVMSLARRRALLEFARQHKVWIIEDDYDSEFRYGSRPLSSLQGLDDAGQVIYVGSLGKMLYPGLRMGYMVVPDNLVDSFRTGVAELYREGQLMQQAVLTEFILDGHLTSHVRRMRGLYGERRELLINAIRERFGETLSVRGDEAGLHFVLDLPDSADDRMIAASALSAGVVTRPLDNYYLNRLAARKGLMLGYACVPNDQIAPHFDKLADVVEQAITSGSSKRAVTSIESASIK